MNQVPSWVAQRLQTLQRCTGQHVQEQSWSDNRLAIVLDALAEPEPWQRLETALNQRLIRVSQLKPQRVRLEGIHLSLVTLGSQLHRHITPLSEVQRTILALLDFGPILYEQLGAESPKPT